MKKQKKELTKKELAKIKMKMFSYTLLFALLFSIVYSTLYYVSHEEIEIKVTKLEQITVGSGRSVSGKFIVYTDDEVFENTDSFLYLKFNSSDVQNELSNNSTVKVSIAGWRIPFLSMYRNIIEIE